MPLEVPPEKVAFIKRRYREIIPTLLKGVNSDLANKTTDEKQPDSIDRINKGVETLDINISYVGML